MHNRENVGKVLITPGDTSQQVHSEVWSKLITMVSLSIIMIHLSDCRITTSPFVIYHLSCLRWRRSPIYERQSRINLSNSNNSTFIAMLKRWFELNLWANDIRHDTRKVVWLGSFWPSLQAHLGRLCYFQVGYGPSRQPVSQCSRVLVELENRFHFQNKLITKKYVQRTKLKYNNGRINILV